GDAVAGRGFAGQPKAAKIEQGSAADVVTDGKVPLSRQRDQISQRYRFGKTADPVIARMDLHQGPGVGSDGALVIGQARDVGGADLAQDGAAHPHDVGNAKTAADLDELAA